MIIISIILALIFGFGATCFVCFTIAGIVCFIKDCRINHKMAVLSSEIKKTSTLIADDTAEMRESK